MKFFKVLLFSLIFLSCFCCENHNSKKMLVIAHRGASAYLPEHILPAKALAYGMNPDYIEQDVVLSKDNIPIVIHDIHLETTTNVASVFPDRCRADGKFYVIDFTWKELQDLYVYERFDIKTNTVIYGKRFPLNKSRFKLHTLVDEIEMIQGLNTSTTHNVGIYVEIKEPNFHRKAGKDISKIVLNILSNYGYNTKKDHCILQCFDATELRKIRDEYKSGLFLVQLLEIGYLDAPFKNKSVEEIVDQISEYADGVGPWYKQLMKGDNMVTSPKMSALVNLSHKKNLKVHAFTFRADDLHGFTSFNTLLKKAEELNFDGIFTDHPDKAVSYFTKKNH